MASPAVSSDWQAGVCGHVQGAVLAVVLVATSGTPGMPKGCVSLEGEGRGPCWLTKLPQIPFPGTWERSGGTGTSSTQQAVDREGEVTCPGPLSYI